ncbi:MAG: type I secretion system permease/ATPase [Zoogloeaceae bacterium]|jgi:ATP-binding cassette subfamily C exporter for protease/lipase|nr:type I secretion system permease/ATPase [Zoogloeaceae bacterium]
MSDEKNISEVRKALRTQKPQFVRAIVFSVVIGALMLAPSFYMLEVYGRVVNSRSVTTLVMLTLLLALAYFVLEFLQWARMGVLRRAAEGFDKILGNRVYEAVFCANLSGERGLAFRGLRDFSGVRDFVGSAQATALMDVPMALLLVGVIFWIDTTLGWFSLVSACIQCLITFLNKQASGTALGKSSGANAQAQNFIQASLRNGEVVQAMGMTEGLRQRWLAMQTDMLRFQAEASDRAGVYVALSKYVQILSGSLILGLGSWLVLKGVFIGDVGLVLMASIIAGRALAPLVQVIAGWRNVVNARESLGRLEILLARIPARPAGLPLPPPQGVLQVEQISAAAPGTSEMILKNIAFAVPPGKILAIAGPSASGKTSLTHLLVGVWPCASGKVRLDGVDVHAWNKRELGAHIGFLPQNVALFEGTIAENIARFGELDEAKIEAAARLTGLHEHILSLPDGYGTDIGTEGAILSGGMRQRVGLARAIYGNPRLVVLDEPNANLDDAGEAALISTLQALRAAGTTVVVVTHRTSLLGVADLMLVLMEGEAKLFGPRNDVLAALQRPPQPPAPAAPAARPPQSPAPVSPAPVAMRA